VDRMQGNNVPGSRYTVPGTASNCFARAAAWCRH
jgi:hypothetical protein